MSAEGAETAEKLSARSQSEKGLRASQVAGTVSTSK